jgi:drug/metabolite transporter (DMT)-like permease
VFIKIGLQDIPPLLFAGLRYSLAFLLLLPLFARPARRASLRTLTARDWRRLLMLGVLVYAVTQGAQFLGLLYLPAVTVSLLLNFTTVMVALLGALFLAERPTWRQWGGVMLSLVGGLLYFYPVALPASQLLGLAIVVIGVLANAASAVLGRSINRASELSPLTVTLVSMGIGALLLLATGVAYQGFPPLSWQSWAIIGWLALVNTAFAFTLWNQTLRTLSAVESSIINNTMLVQIALLAWVFLGERLTPQEIGGLVLAALGALFVQRFNAQEARL